MIFLERPLFEHRPEALIKVSGEDAFSFLQGQFTNELRQGPGRETYGLWLNQKGKVLADSHVLRIAENEFLLVSFLSPAALIMKRLEDYVVADDVVLTDLTAEHRGLWVAGAGSGEVLARHAGGRPEVGAFSFSGDAWIFRGRRSGAENYEIIGTPDTVEKIGRAFLAEGWSEVQKASVDYARISAGIPAVPGDVGPTDLPNEAGLDETAISYTKGCYLGQEVMARLKNLGQVRRRLHVVQGNGSAPSPGAALYQKETKVGEVRTVAAHGETFVAMAMLSLINFKPGEGLSLEPSGPQILSVKAHG